MESPQAHLFHQSDMPEPQGLVLIKTHLVKAAEPVAFSGDEGISLGTIEVASGERVDGVPRTLRKGHVRTVCGYVVFGGWGDDRAGVAANLPGAERVTDATFQPGLCGSCLRTKVGRTAYKHACRRARTALSRLQGMTGPLGGAAIQGPQTIALTPEALDIVTEALRQALSRIRR